MIKFFHLKVNPEFLTVMKQTDKLMIEVSYLSPQANVHVPEGMILTQFYLETR